MQTDLKGTKELRDAREDFWHGEMSIWRLVGRAMTFSLLFYTHRTVAPKNTKQRNKEHSSKFHG